MPWYSLENNGHGLHHGNGLDASPAKFTADAAGIHPSPRQRGIDGDPTVHPYRTAPICAATLCAWDTCGPDTRAQPVGSSIGQRHDLFVRVERDDRPRGPKISSWEIFASASTSAKIVGSTKKPARSGHPP